MISAVFAVRIAAVQFMEIINGGLIHSRTLFNNSSSIQKLRGSVNWPESMEEASSTWITTSSLVHFFLWSHDKQWPIKKARWTNATALSVKTSISKVQQRPAKNCKANQCYPIIPCLLCYTYILSKHHMLSQASTLAKHHMPLFQAASKKRKKDRKYICSQQNILPCVCFSKNILS